MKAMILAAGRGKRLRPTTDTIPKPLIRVGEHALIEHQLYALAHSGFNDVVINVAYLADKIVATLGTGDRYGVRIHYSYEVESGLETGGGIFNALPLLGKEYFLVISADIWTDYPFDKLHHFQSKELAHLILVDNPPYHPQGDFNFDGIRLVEGPGDRLTFGCIGIYHPDLFLGCQKGYFPLAPLLVEAIKSGRATGEHFKGEWWNVGTLEELQALLKNVESRK